MCYQNRTKLKWRSMVPGERYNSDSEHNCLSSIFALHIAPDPIVYVWQLNALMIWAFARCYFHVHQSQAHLHRSDRQHAIFSAPLPLSAHKNVVTEPQFVICRLLWSWRGEKSNPRPYHHIPQWVLCVCWCGLHVFQNCTIRDLNWVFYTISWGGFYRISDHCNVKTTVSHHICLLMVDIKISMLCGSSGQNIRYFSIPA